VVAKLFHLQHDSMLSTPTGEFVQLISKVFRNLDTLLPALYGSILPLFAEVAVAVVFIGVAYGPIALAQLGLFVAFSGIAYSAAGKKAQRNKDMMTALLSEWGKIMATAGSYERAHFFDNVDFEVAGARESFEKIGTKITAVSSGEHLESMALTGVSLTCTVGFILLLPSTGAAGLELAALAFYFITFIGSLEPYALGVSNLRSAVFEYQAFGEFLNRLSDVSDVPSAVALKPTKNPTIEFKGVSFSYGGRVILDDVSFRVEGGHTLGLVGSSGCGKSTVLRLLLRFYRPTKGLIEVDGVDIRVATGASLRRLFSVVTQDAALFNGTIRENIGYGKMGSTDGQVLAAARLAELHLAGQTAPPLPVAEGAGAGSIVGGAAGAELAEQGNDLTLDKACGEKGAKLSGGQQQRVALARAMLKNGTIYLLDEPTTGLDGVVAKQLQATLDSLSASATTLCITHHLEDLRHAHGIVYLDQGRVVERGTFESLMEAKGAFFRQVQARK
jgi:ABC-type multidrug transport system fused ATPase/permease subunit